jgi:cell surface protein SprA
MLQSLIHCLGKGPTQQSLVNAFDNNPEAREYQDVGLNGLRTVDERLFFSEFLDDIGNLYGQDSPAFINAGKILRAIITATSGAGMGCGRSRYPDKVQVL